MDIISLNIEGTQPPPPTGTEFQNQAALLSAVCAVAVALTLRFGFGAPLIPELMADALFEVIPIRIVEFGVALFGPFAKHAAFIGCVLIYGTSLTGLAIAGLRAGAPAQPEPVVATRYDMSVVRAIGLSLIGFLLTALVVTPLLGGSFFGRRLPQGALLTVIAFSLIAITQALALIVAPRVLLQAESLHGGTESKLSERLKLLTSRRRLIRWAGYAVVGFAAYDMGVSLWGSWRQGRSGRVKGGNGVFPTIDGLAREITPVDEFYQVSKNAFDPRVDSRAWRLEITGLVDNPLSLSYDEVRSLPSVEHYATLECIDNLVGGNLIGNALWRGVTVKELLNRAGVRSDAVDLILKAADGYTDSIPMSRALSDGTLLAYEMNGAPLESSHGFPLRLIVPGIFGMKNVKWITGIEPVDFDFKGYWQRRGWDDRAEYKTMSRIDVPTDEVHGTTTIAGIAFAGDRGISKVEVSVNGKDWEPALIKPPLSAYAWALWHLDYSPTTNGPLRVTVRATDGNGAMQSSEATSPIPSGASGNHQLTLDIEL